MPNQYAYSGFVAKAASYQCLDSDSGTRFTNRGAGGSITFTLPATLVAGWHAKFIGIADQTFIVAGAATTVLTFNNGAATSVAAQTSSAKIGAEIDVECDGTVYIVRGTTVGVTYTVA